MLPLCGQQALVLLLQPGVRLVLARPPGALTEAGGLSGGPTQHKVRLVAVQGEVTVRGVVMETGARLFSGVVVVTVI